MSNLEWTINCILFGAEIVQTLRNGKEEEIVTKIKNLSSELDDTNARYIVMRLKEAQ